VVANLWDVTDKDIDRFSATTLHHWLGCAPPQDSDACDSDRDKNDRGSAAPGGPGDTVASAVAASRGVCKLPHLIGAAPVVYGLPTRVAWRQEQS
jgi:separase